MEDTNKQLQSAMLRVLEMDSSIKKATSALKYVSDEKKNWLIDFN